MEVIFRNDIVEQARAGDKLVFSGSLVVVPDVSVITAPGQRSLLKGAGETFLASQTAAWVLVARDSTRSFGHWLYNSTAHVYCCGTVLKCAIPYSNAKESLNCC